MEHNHECLHHHHHEGHSGHEHHHHTEHIHAVEFHAGDLCSRGLCCHIEHQNAQFDPVLRTALEAQFESDDDEDEDTTSSKKSTKLRAYKPVAAS